MKTLQLGWLLGVAALVLAPGSYGARLPEVPANPPATAPALKAGSAQEDAFRAMDADGDGYISWEEFARAAGPLPDYVRLRFRFDQIDQDGDGRLSFAESLAAMDADEDEAEE